MLQQNTVMLQEAVRRTNTLRQSHPKVRAPASIFEAAVDDSASMHTYTSAATDTTFTFDNDIVNSQAYRRVLASRSREHLSAGPKLSASHDTESDTETVIHVSESGFTEDQLAFVPISLHRKLTKQEIASLVTKYEQSVQRASENLENSDEFRELREKYVKVKKYYFEKDDQVNGLQKELNELRASLTSKCQRLEARIPELEMTNEHLEKTRVDLQRLLDAHAANRASLCEAFTRGSLTTNPLTTNVVDEYESRIAKQIDEAKSRDLAHQKELASYKDDLATFVQEKIVLEGKCKEIGKYSS
jgi:hypothetical protein